MYVYLEQMTNKKLPIIWCYYLPQFLQNHPQKILSGVAF